MSSPRTSFDADQSASHAERWEDSSPAIGDASIIAPRVRAVSVVMPAFNEEAGIGDQIEKVEIALKQSVDRFEIIVVDDGSTDRTADVAREHDVRLIRLPANRGYGAALKVGIAAAEHEVIVIIDADGTYPAESIPSMLERAGDFDMVVGARVGRRVHIPLVRRPAKWLLGRLASYLAQRRIPDLNSGLRVIRKSIVEEFEHLLPSGFSFTTTITLAHLCNDYCVHYHPIDYHRRIGSSKIRMTHPYQFLVQILRTIVFFNPLRVFLPVGGVLFLAGAAKLIYDIAVWDISDSATMGILGGVVIWSIGLLADQIARVSRIHSARRLAPRGDQVPT
jgi:glycosyltransferase involved in cell wall biosynthesis